MNSIIKMDTLIKGQVMALPEFSTQIVQSHSIDGLENDWIDKLGITEESEFVFLGCGDSAASGEISAVFAEQLIGVKAWAENITQFQYFVEPQNFSSTTVLVLTSVSGTNPMIGEAIKKAQRLEIKTLVLTNSPQKAVSLGADAVLNMGFENKIEDWPGLKSYFAGLVTSLMFIYAVGIRLGRVTINDYEKAQKDIIRYACELEKELPKIDEQMFWLAEKEWKKYDRFHFLGCGKEHGSAWFSAQKFCEVCGALTDEFDTEDWCHIGYHLKNPQDIATVFIVDSHDSYFSRTIETINAACGISRPCLVVTNTKKELFPAEAIVVSMPEIENEPFWLMPLYDYIAPSILAGYCSEMRNKGIFKMHYVARERFFKKV